MKVPPDNYIAVWHDPRIPQCIVEKAKTIVVSDKLREDSGVEIFNGVHCELVCTDGYCGEHRDWSEVSLLWVARNDKKSWVGVKNIIPVKSQPVGTLILIDIDFTHYQQQPGGSRGQPGVWVAALVSSFPEWPCNEEIEQCIQEFLNKYK